MNSVSGWAIWNDLPTTDLRKPCFHKLWFYNRIAPLSKETFGVYLTLEKRRNAEDLVVEHFASASVFAKAHEPCHSVTCAYTCFCQTFRGCYGQNIKGIRLGLWVKFKIYSSLIRTGISGGLGVKVPHPRKFRGGGGVKSTPLFTENPGGRGVLR